MLEPFRRVWVLSKVEADGTPRIATSEMCSIGRSGDRAIRPPAVGAPNCTGDAVALAFAREGADVLISYLGSEEVDADEAVR
ncbi:MAG TPA: hypothetical protein VI094_07645 [Propionibacteriaceae bacterium]